LEKGFTLLEVLAALVILTAGVLASAGMFAISVDGLRFGARMTRALSLAQEKMELLREGGRWRRRDGEDVEDSIHRSWRTERDPDDPQRLYLIVKTSWQDRSGTLREIALESVIFDPIPEAPID
jgi:prepilin-type N-terminal cleavage/methylation domain-containing protein